MTRMALAGAVGIALSGCGNGNGTSFSPGGTPNGAGGGNAFVNPVAVANPKLPPIVIDDGTVSKGAYTSTNATATDTQSATQAPSGGTVASPADSTDAGSQSISFAGSGNPTVFFKYANAVPSLTYQSGVGSNTSFIDYSTLNINAAVTPAAGAPTPTSISVELTGGSGTSAYDVRVSCGTPTTTLKLYKCALPAYGTASNVQTPNPITPGATGLFTPVGSTSLYVVLVYSGSSNATIAGNNLLIDDVYATP